jgi:type III pantothenate kinase
MQKDMVQGRSTSLLVMDIGNTSISLGLFSGTELRGTHRVSSDRKRTAAGYRSEIDGFLSTVDGGTSLDGVILSSVVRGLEEVLTAAVKGLSAREPLLVTGGLKTGLTLDVEKPQELGADRIANAVAARDLLGDPVIAADLGTATTLTAVRGDRVIGGAILSGIGVMADALHRKTSRLPLVRLEETPVGPPNTRALGKDTTKCILSGIIYGTAGAVERIAEEIERETGSSFLLALTGGYAEMIAPYLRRDFRLCPDLTLQGLRLLFERNS